ncbi:hypothetical protein Bbelb_384650 [Branchiostoma belcheri]|nr:hypothetical protein Bbelb_384650 [Branchiostoma belcheri]
MGILFTQPKSLTSLTFRCLSDTFFRASDWCLTDTETSASGKRLVLGLVSPLAAADLQDVTTASKDNASAAKRTALDPGESPAHRPKGSKQSSRRRSGRSSDATLGYFMQCQGNGTNTGATPVGAYRLDPPTGRR